jgi:hypothetical protein
MFRIRNADERTIAAQGISGIVARVWSMGQFTARGNEPWAINAKKEIVRMAVDNYMEELLRIGFSIELDDEEEED